MTYLTDRPDGPGDPNEPRGPLRDANRRRRPPRRPGWLIPACVAVAILAAVLVALALRSTEPANVWGRSNPTVTTTPRTAPEAPAASDPAQAPASPANEPPGPAQAPEAAMPGDGDFSVGTTAADVQPGRYRSPGPENPTGFCFWFRRDITGEKTIASNGSKGPQIVTVRAGEVFSTSNCQGWRKV